MSVREMNITKMGITKMVKESKEQIAFEIGMTRDFLDFVISMKAEGIETAREIIGTLESMVSADYVQPPLEDRLRAFLVVLYNMEDVGMNDSSGIISYMSNVYIEQTSGDFYESEEN